MSRLPTSPGTGNILLADAEARTLRNLFAAEAYILSPAFASNLKTFLEQHIGLRVYYPEIANFYRDVQTGRIQEALPLDSVEGVVQSVRESTPSVFDPSVESAIQDSVQPPPPAIALPANELPAPDANQPVPPRDPLGEISPEKAHDFTVASVVNELWKAFLAGEKVNKALEGWAKARTMLSGDVGKILDWLHRWMNSGDGPPTLPPT